MNANATNTVALWPGQPASVWAYRKELSKIPRRAVIPLTITGIIGGIAGAYVLLITPQQTFMRLVPWLLLTATVIFTLSGPITRWVRLRAAHSHNEFSTKWGVLLQLFIAFYLGYFGAASAF